MAQFRNNGNGINNSFPSIIAAGGVGGSGVLTSISGLYDRIATSLNAIKLEILATTENIRSFLTARFAIDGQFMSNFVSRFKLSFPLMSGIVVGMFLEEIKNGSAITKEQLILFSNIPIAALVGRRLRVIDRCGSVSSVTLIPSPCGTNFFINIDSCETVSANGFIFLDVYPERLTSERMANERLIANGLNINALGGRRIGISSDRVCNGSGISSERIVGDRLYPSGAFIAGNQSFVSSDISGRRCNCCSDSTDY
jgi:hypothetical protein